jgi:L-lactate dehydrogenase complex protein LldG
MTEGALLDRFTSRARAAGTEVTHLERAADLAAVVAAMARDRGVRSAAAWDVPLLRPVTAALAAAGIAVIADAAAADLGLTTVDHAIAESGTLVLAAGPGRPRAASLLPPHHVAVLPRDRIVFDLAALFPLLGAPPSALTFITGPSRTADIELTPVRGAHGPIGVTVVVVPGGVFP